MSSAAPALEYAKPEPKRLFGLDLRRLGKNSWALMDQILISGANFVTQVLVARALGNHQSEFGTFAVISGVLLWCNMFQSTLITQAHNVLGATRVGQAYRRYTTSTTVEQIVLLGIQVVLALPMVIIAHVLGWSSAAMIVALVPTIVTWQAMEFVRRVLYTEGRYRDAFLTDLVGYGGQMVLLGWMFYAARHGGPEFTGAKAFYAMAVSCGVAALMGAWLIRHSVERGMSRDDARENWHFGKWLLGGELLGWASSVHMMVWWAALILGTAASADLRAAQILFGPTRVISFFLATVLPIRFVQILHNDGPRAMHRNLYFVIGTLIPVVGLYCVLLAIYPRPLLDLIYGGTYADSAAAVLRLYALTAFLGYLQMVVVAALTAAKQTQLVFTGSIVGCVISLVLGPLCIWLLDSEGAIIAMLIACLVVTIEYWFAYRRHFKEHLAEPIAATVEEPA